MEFNVDGPSGPLQIALTLIVGLGAMGYGAYSYSSQSAALASTETTNATIVSTSIERLNKRRGTDDYSPQATFTYIYEGESYTSSHMYPGGVAHELETKEDARAKVEGYERGTTVTVYVPSHAPEEAFLKHESSNKPLYIMGFGALFVLGSIVSVFRFGRRSSLSESG